MRVSVIIPCYNVEDHVEVAVRSVMDQTYADLDVFAVDDGSTDGTRAKLEALERSYPGRFRWVGGPRRGACAARNIGLANTTGEYVQFLDADDAILTDKIFRQVDLAKATDMPDIIVADFLNVYEDGREEKITSTADKVWMALLRTQLGTTSADLFKRSSIQAVGGWNEEQLSSQDYELMFRMLKNGATVRWDPHVSSLVLKRSQGSISRTGLSENWKRYIALRRAIREHLHPTDPQGYQQEISTADQVLFMAIRVLAKQEPTEAYALFNAVMPKGFVPDRASATTALYTFWFRILGFRTTDTLARAFGRLRHRGRHQRA